MAARKVALENARMRSMLVMAGMSLPEISERIEAYGSEDSNLTSVTPPIMPNGQLITYIDKSCPKSPISQQGKLSHHVIILANG